MAEFGAFSRACIDEVTCNNLLHHLKMCLQWMWRNNEKQMHDLRRYKVKSRVQRPDVNNSNVFPVFSVGFFFFVNTLIKIIHLVKSPAAAGSTTGPPVHLQRDLTFQPFLTPTNRKVEQKKCNKNKEDCIVVPVRQRTFFGDNHMWG